MGRVSTCLFSVILFLTFLMASSVEEQVKQALVKFMGKLSPGNIERDPNFGWNVSSDPCKDRWYGVTCDSQLLSVRKIVLEQLNLNGVLDAASLCNTTSLQVLSLNNNNLGGEIPSQISNCQSLTHIYLSGNHFSGSLPVSLVQIVHLKTLDISMNNLSNQLPDMSRISGLVRFLAQNNQLSGEIPNFDYTSLVKFNVSNNNLSGLIPDSFNGHFNSYSFLGNPQLCGKPLPNLCPQPPRKTMKTSSKLRYIVYSGYGVLVVAVLFLAFKLLIGKNANAGGRKKEVELDSTSNKTSDISSKLLTTGSRYRSEYSIRKSESGQNSYSLVVLSSAGTNELKFDDLLKAPAELVGRGKNGSLFKVMLDSGVTLAVKRIKNYGIPRDDFKKRMKRIDQVKHPNVLPVVAYYTSKQEKLLVYEFQQNGSLFKLLHESQEGKLFNWESRISVAASIAQTLAFMHEELHNDGIAHGNLKSSNILLNKNMEPYISEYGVMMVESYQYQSPVSQSDSIKSVKSEDTPSSRAFSAFKVDIYGLGVILLELLTGKIVQNGGLDLGAWVHAVVSEEWTVEVFDCALISEGAHEERMVNLLQVALKCIKPSLDERPSIDEVAIMINSIKEEEEGGAMSYEP